jgi:3-isopropylmalate/(R)-2-methylmalate dehydratase small subunit
MAKIIYKVGDDVSTDIIYPGRFMATVLPTETPQYAFADDAQFSKKLKSGEVPKGGILLAGQNFGCGSSREQAASCLMGYDLIVVAKHFSRIFLQNSINLGLRMIICPDIEASEGDELTFEGDQVQNVTTGKKFKIVSLPQARQAIIDAGGLVAYTRTLLLNRTKKGN